MTLRVFPTATLSAFCSMLLISACGNGDSKIPITMDGWRDITIGGSKSIIENYIGKKTRTYSFSGCTNYQSLEGVPRATSVTVHNASQKIVSFGMGGVAKLKTPDGLGLYDKLEDVHTALGGNYSLVTKDDYFHPEPAAYSVTRSNMGKVALQWKDAKGIGPERARAIRYETWRSDSNLKSIQVGDYNEFGDSICD